MPDPPRPGSPSSISSAASGVSDVSTQRRRASSVAVTPARALVFVSAVISALCAGSITVFSLYGHIFQERLFFTQLQVNLVAIAGTLALYVPVSLLGYLCDRVGPAPLALLSSLLFGGGYGLAAYTYRQLDKVETLPQLFRQTSLEAVITSVHAPSLLSAPQRNESRQWGYICMLVAFVCIGTGTCSMYLAAVATCAKNFGKGRHRGIALAVPIAAFGLSGMWMSQLGTRVFYERLPNGERGDLDVFQFFVFLSLLLLTVGVLGSCTLRVMDEDDIIYEAAEELERSGLLVSSTHVGAGNRMSYGSLDIEADDFDGVAALSPNGGGEFRDPRIRPSLDVGSPRFHDLHDDMNEQRTRSLLGGIRHHGEDDEEEAWKKTKKSVLNAETRQFLMDPTMWCLAVGFLLMVGPGEAFTNNLGTVLGTLYTPSPSSAPTLLLLKTKAVYATSPATHVSIIGVTSTIARLLTGTLTDWLAQSPSTQHLQYSASGMTSSGTLMPQRRWTVSRVVFLLFFALVLSLGLGLLSVGFAQEHAERFWFISVLVGSGYGAVFSLTPIMITVIWGVENFATNWGIVAMFPALGTTFWGLVYSAVYEAGARNGGPKPKPTPTPPLPPFPPPRELPDGGNLFCHGQHCYASAFGAMTVSVWVACLFILWAWRGPGGWKRRGVVI